MNKFDSQRVQERLQQNRERGSGQNPQNPQRPQQPNQQSRPVSNNTVLAKTQTRRGEVQRAARRVSENVNLQASQHVIDVPVNKSVFNGYGGRQFTLNMQKTIPRRDGPTLKIMETPVKSLSRAHAQPRPAEMASVSGEMSLPCNG